MPYIPQRQREHFQLPIEVALSVLKPGQLTYILTTIVQTYLRNMGECYDTYNTIIGALECTKLELYRRKVASYENTKIEMNGDVF